MPTAQEVWSNAEMIIKVKEPVASEYNLIGSGQTLFTYFHLAAVPDLDDRAVDHPEHFDAAVLEGASVALGAAPVPVDRHHRGVVVQHDRVEVQLGAQVERRLQPLDRLVQVQRLDLTRLVPPGGIGDQLGDEVEATLVVEDVEVALHGGSRRAGRRFGVVGHRGPC